MIKILTVIDYSSQSERRLLQGLIDYADAHGFIHKLSRSPPEK